MYCALAARQKEFRCLDRQLLQKCRLHGVPPMVYCNVQYNLDAVDCKPLPRMAGLLMREASIP
jgi:hypothetical protein